MNERSIFFKGAMLSGAALTVLAGCAFQPKPVADKVRAQEAQCSAARSGEALIGNWLAVRKQRGVVGELHILLTLKADGEMTYVEQLKRGKQPPRTLSETGCWTREAQQLILQTTRSNGVPVEADDPIYRNQYQITSTAADRLGLRTADGSMAARRMPDDYRLSTF